MDEQDRLDDEITFGESLDREPMSDYTDETTSETMGKDKLDEDFKETLDSESDQIGENQDGLGDKLNQAYNDLRDD